VVSDADAHKVSTVGRGARFPGDCSERPAVVTTRSGSRGAAVAEGGLDGEVLEAHELLEEGQRDLAGGAVALLGDVDLDDAFVLAGFAVAAVQLGAVDAQYGIRVMLEAAGLAKIGETRLAVLPVL